MVEVELEEEKKEIVRRYRRLLRHAKPILKDGDAKIIKKAFNTSMEAHSGMRRRSGEPYIFHPIEVAMICIDEIGLGTTSIVCALLHDVVEDTDITLSDIEHMFGKKVSRIIDGLTKISGVFEQGSSQQAENFRKMLLTLSEDVRVILIKLADRLHNMRTLESMPRAKQLKISSETSYIYAPLAHRLGLYAIKSELEDLYLKFTDREIFDSITHKISDTKDSRNKFIRNFIRPIKDEIDSLGFDYQIKGRPKSVYSIWDKMRKQNVPFEEVFDLFAIRIIIDTPLESEKAICWQVYSIVTDFYQPNPDRLRDWISIPKANGYESLHTTVMSDKGKWVEVQIRTRRMDEIAEKGYAAHWKYKDSVQRTAEDSGLEMWIGDVREALSQNKESAIEFVDDFRSNLYSDEVFVFTPKGDLFTLPQDSTALDFAFNIHTEVGARCIGAKVNQKLVPLNHKLKNGDQVEILTSGKQKPNEDWLKIAVTSKARSKIKDSLKEERKAFVADGKEIVRRKLKQMKLTLDQSVLEELVEYFKLKSPTDLYYLLGIGKIEHSEIKRFRDRAKIVKQKAPKEITIKPVVKKTTDKKDGELLLIGENMDKIDYKLARCCNPIPGDDVFGFVTVSDGIKIHRANCPNATELLSNYGYRVVKANWTTRHSIAFLAGLKIIGTDRIGIISDVSEVISSQLKVNMRSLSINTDDGFFEGEIQVYVDDTHHLETLIKKLQKIEGVESVSRYN